MIVNSVLSAIAGEIQLNQGKLFSDGKSAEAKKPPPIFLCFCFGEKSIFGTIIIGFETGYGFLSVLFVFLLAFGRG